MECGKQAGALSFLRAFFRSSLAQFSIWRHKIDAIGGEMTPNNPEPRLYGIENSNRRNSEIWGKNCFNSAFPVSLACHMRDQGMPAVYVRAVSQQQKIKTENASIDIGDVFNTSAANSELSFCFESKYQPYLEYSALENELDGADLVVKRGEEFLRPLQIKLTVTPDDGTSKGGDPKNYAPELVLRPADTSTCAIGMFDAIKNKKDDILNLLDDSCRNINWSALRDNQSQKEKIIDGVEKFLCRYQRRQKPYLLQTIWKTEGKSPFLSPQNALDVFIWSDYALLTACLSKATISGDSSRGFRAIARFARAQHRLAERGSAELKSIYREMDFGRQTDKEVSLSGRETANFLTSPFRAEPRLAPDILRHIILNNGHKKLSPERRFDQTVFFTASRIFGE